MRRRCVPEHSPLVRSTAPGSRRRYRMEPPLRAAEYRLILGLRSAARPQACLKASHIISEE